MLDMVQDLFHPNARHAEDERQRLEHTRVVEGDHGTGCGPVDLESGAVVVLAPESDAVLPPRPGTEEAADGEAGGEV